MIFMDSGIVFITYLDTIGSRDSCILRYAQIMFDLASSVEGMLKSSFE